MLGIVSRLFSTMLVAGCFFSLTFFLFSLAALFRLLPRLLPFIKTMLRVLLIMSVRFYAFILTPINNHLNIDLLNGIPRVLASMLLSLMPGLFLYYLADQPPPVWGITLTGLHGLIVGLLWDDILDPGGFLLGVNIQ